MNRLSKEIEKLIIQLDDLKNHFNFNDAQNEDEACDAIESAVVALDELEEISERDIEYTRVKKMME